MIEDPSRRARLKAALLDIAEMCSAACLDNAEEREAVAETMVIGVLAFENAERMERAKMTELVERAKLKILAAQLAESLTYEQTVELLTKLTSEQEAEIERLVKSSTFGKSEVASSDDGDAP